MTFIEQHPLVLFLWAWLFAKNNYSATGGDWQFALMSVCLGGMATLVHCQLWLKPLLWSLGSMAACLFMMWGGMYRARHA